MSARAATVPGLAGWIAVDWGTSNLRVWAMTAADEVLAEYASDRGMSVLAPGEYEGALVELAAPHLAPGKPAEVVVCGMAGARGGWVEAPYRAVPCVPVGRGAVLAPTRDPRLRVRILPGLSQADPAEVMRGEETQIAGFLQDSPDFDGVLCLPGTHGKWVRLRDGVVQSFRTAMSGEVFSLLASRSVLRHGADAGWNDGTFDAAVWEMAERPETLALALFSVRARGLLAAPREGEARARLSGLLLGAELAATRAMWQAAPVVVIGTPKLSALYQRALRILGADARSRDSAGLVLAGLAAARRMMQEDNP